MAIRTVLVYPDRRLREKARPVEVVDDTVRWLLDDLAETMYGNSGIGLAAPQVGVSLRVFVIDLKSPVGGELLEFINPRLLSHEGETVWNEGCLSFPGIWQDIQRSRRVTIEALDRNGQQFTLQGEDLLAVALQHECDHLDGRLLIDHVSYLKKRMIRREMAKQAAERAAAAGAGSR